MLRMTTCHALKLGLALAILFGAVATRRASARRITGIDRCHEDPRELCLVLNEFAQLIEGPTSDPCSLSLRKRCPVADALEVFQGNAAMGVLSEFHEPFRELVVYVFSVSTLLFPHAGHYSVASSSPLAIGAFGLSSKGATATRVSHPLSLDWLRRVRGTIRINKNVCDADVYSDEISWRNHGPFGNINRNQQKPFAVLPSHKVGLPFTQLKSFGLVLAHDEWHDYSTVERGETNSVDSFETDVFAHGVRYCCMLPKLRLFGPVSIVCLSCLSEASASHVSRQTESLAQFSVCDLLQLEGSGDSAFKCYPGEPCSRFVESFNSLGQLLRRGFIGKQFELDHDLHARSVWSFLPYVNSCLPEEVGLV